MQILGFQKMTLLDFPGKVACTVFTGGCNLRCPFCHNALLVTDIHKEDSVEDAEIFDLLKKRKGLLDGVAITGGEPLLQPDLRDFILRVRELGFAVKLDHNGAYPDKLRALCDEGIVDYVAMDIKNSPEKYAATVGMKALDLSPYRESVAYLLSGKQDYEFRTTVVDELHVAEDFTAIGEWIAGAKRYFLQKFTDSGNLIGEGFHTPGEEKMQAILNTVTPFVPNTSIRG